MVASVSSGDQYSGRAASQNVACFNCFGAWGGESRSLKLVMFAQPLRVSGKISADLFASEISLVKVICLSS